MHSAKGRTPKRKEKGKGMKEMQAGDGGAGSWGGG